MCGIAGLIGGGHGARERALAMRAALAHRGPDGEGMWWDGEADAVLAHTRLAIQDLSGAGAQPMVSACGRLVMVYNGECFNAPELRQTLEEEGAHFRGTGDSEVILAAFARWGVEAALGRIAGEFALGLWDRRARVLTLARDRVGVKPLYWARSGAGLAFASELKGLLPALPHEPGIDRAALGSYLRTGAVAQPLTIHEGVRQLGPGAVLRWRPGAEPEIRAWWSLEDTLAAVGPADRVEDPGEGRALIEETLGQAVRQRLLADVPLGVFLSGGIDSTLIAALMAEQADGTVASYSIGSTDATYDEGGAAAAVAGALGLEHHRLDVGEAACLDAIPAIPGTWDEPFGDSSAIPAMILSRMTRRHVTVALSGDGGDELFAGYNRHRWFERMRQMSPVRGRAFAVAAGAAGVMPARLVDGLGHLAGEAGAARRIGKLGAMAGASDAAGAHAAAVTQWHGLGPVAPAPAAYAMAERLGALAPVERMQAIDIATYLRDDILTKVDRASMASALEVRVPFLDHRVIGAAFRLAPALKLRDGTTKWLLRRMLDDRVPRALVERPKQGFAIPLERWLRGRLRDWADGLISGTDWEGRFGIDPAPVGRAWARHLAGRGGEADRLWTVLMLAAWDAA